MKISFMVHTASMDDFLKSQRIESFFANTIECLRRQTLQDFEFIYIDTHYETNKEYFASISAPFQVKHVPIHKDHRYWFDRGNTYIAAAKNTGILYADGRLLITCDDGQIFDEKLLERYWKYYKSGYLMNALYKRLRKVETKDGKVKFPIKGDMYVNDHRWKYAKIRRFHSDGSWIYSGASFPLEYALFLNGVNERMDANKSLDDCDFGYRIAAIQKEKFVIDPKGFTYIIDHPSYINLNPHKITDFIAVENYGVLRCGIDLLDIIANKYPMTEAHMKIIQRETIKYRKFDPLDEAHKENLAIWLATPTFDLRQQREELRASSDWRW